MVESSSSAVSLPPHLVVFEGVDGSGKTTLAQALTDYYRQTLPNALIHSGAFPGSEAGTLGAWVYQLHHGRASAAFSPGDLAPAALQLLHVAAHVDSIVNRLTSVLRSGGYVVLDRYWWSTYAYSRRHLTEDQAWALVNAERPFWKDLPPPTVVYLSRESSLKPDEVDDAAHEALRRYYGEVLAAERRSYVSVHELQNDGPLQATWENLLDVLNLPYRELPEFV